jgi:hypothetical protein
MNRTNLGKVATIVVTAVALMVSVRAIMSIIKDIVCNEHSFMGIVYRVFIILMVTSLTILAIKFLTYQDK